MPEVYLLLCHGRIEIYSYTIIKSLNSVLNKILRSIIAIAEISFT
jgi:hypothetical protein